MTGTRDEDRSPQQYRAGVDGDGRSTVGVAAGADTGTAGGALTVHDLWQLEPGVGSPERGGPCLDVGVPPGGSRAFVSTFRQAYDSGLHRTATVDLSTVVAGSVTFCTETAQVELHAGDSVVVPGVLHGWQAAQPGCVLLVVMVGVSG